jgi:hypothetical protein
LADIAASAARTISDGIWIWISAKQWQNHPKMVDLDLSWIWISDGIWI